MSNEKNRLILKLLGLLISTIPPIISALSFFPIWKSRGAKEVISGLALIFILLSAIPIFRALKSALHSPSAPLVWFFIFIIFLALSRIANEVTVIAFVGFISNLAGSFLFYLSRKGKENKKI